MLFSSSLITYGRGKGIVVETGIPKVLKWFAIVVFPLPIPPVNPIILVILKL